MRVARLRKSAKTYANPKILLKSVKEIFMETRKYINTFKDIPYVFNLGHGLLPQTDPDKVRRLIEFYRNF